MHRLWRTAPKRLNNFVSLSEISPVLGDRADARHFSNGDISMENISQGDIDARISRNVNFHSALLVRDNAVPGMERDDYRQDLLTDFIYRRRRFDHRRASIRTFADRIVRHRASELRCHTHWKAAERTTRSLDEPISEADGSQRPFGETLLDDDAPGDVRLGLVIDLKRFVDRLPPRLVGCCNILMTGSVTRGALACRVSRSTVYEDITVLRDCAALAGLRVYLSDRADTSRSAPVCGSSSTTARPSTLAMNGSVDNARLIASEFDHWLETAEAGSRFEYHRGFLAMDAGSDSTGELVRLARRVREASDRRLVHLVQHRLQTGVYCYLAIARRREPEVQIRSLITAEAA